MAAVLLSVLLLVFGQVILGDSQSVLAPSPETLRSAWLCGSALLLPSPTPGPNVVFCASLGDRLHGLIILTSLH